ncbi:UDP-glucuronosyltransferase 2B1 isoform X1 [Strongylocentrotus purpuratus]|uniref:UDP-glucuronosyltransferase n=1 Tax=Strongylocentrotus purpuratus TaxID=7668 RepID=A0A7M7RDV0_STRPU|nr:UDP-glucuronosyltransferase 2B1 isoform X1 [Strongylocentrotus purpuratus]|eukprot:XP_791720.3 PREDICTED: UDP-glucuronosyltransferase 2B1 isoform X1 [Strongylocentrotus purpuratus]
MAHLSSNIIHFSCVLLIFMNMPSNIFSSKILISAIYGEGSHFLAGASLGEGLARKGHDVTMLISNAYEHRLEDPRYANLSFEVFKHPVPPEEVREAFAFASTLVFRDDNIEFFSLMKNMSKRTVDDCEAVVTDKELMLRLEKNDAIIVDITWPCARYIQVVLEEKMKSQRHRTMISLSATNPWSGYLKLGGAPVNYAYFPEISTGFNNRMTFSQKILNIIQTNLIAVVGEQLTPPLYREMGKRLGLRPNIHPIFDMQDFDLHLLNINFASDFVTPLSPSIIPVGGLTVRPLQTLNEELEEFVQSSGEHGVIVFTLGTYLASITTIRPEIVTMFAEAFRRLPQKVIWQLKELPDWELPSNVKAMPWLPQNDLLGHPKTRAFMYQGGNNGFQEACYHGVPIVVIPLQGDQYDVAARIEARGLGKKIEKLELNAEIIYETLTEVIKNPSYKKVADQVSAIYKDQPMSAPDRAAFWIEHVIKFGGAYMRSPANDLTFIQYHLLDVYAFLTAVIVIFLAVVYYTLKFCLTRCCRMIGLGSSRKSKTE